MRGEKLTSGAT